MDTSELSWDLAPEELEALKLVSLGCHQSCYEELESLFRQHEIVSWTINDYFLLKPLARDIAKSCIEEGGDQSNWGKLARPQLYYPFFERRIREIPFLPDVDPGGKEFNDDEASRRADEKVRRDLYKRLIDEAKDPSDKTGAGKIAAIEHVLNWPIKSNDQAFASWLRRDFRTFVSTLFDGSNGLRLLRMWAHNEGDARNEELRLNANPSTEFPSLHRNYTVWEIVEDLLIQLTPLSDDDYGAFDDTARAMSRNDMAAARVEHAVNDHFWLLQSRPVTCGSASNCINVNAPATALVAVSIASKAHFYGYLVVEYPPQPKPLDELQKDIEQILRNKSVGNYLDVLVLFFNRIYEARLKRELDNSIKKTSSQIQKIIDRFFENGIEFSELPDPLVRPLTEVEDWVRWLWQQRRKWWKVTKSHKAHPAPNDTKRKPRSNIGWEDIDPLRRSLVLAKMEIASPPMVDVIRNLMNFHIEYNPDASQLPSVLVIGGPGSGKDAIARLVALFGVGYTFGDIETINMAAMRPQALIGPMLQGLEVGTMKWESVFPVVKDDHPQDRAVTVVLDELNSLDIDQQGILLRILENREVTPIFSRAARRANFLCVGIMNERPEDLMKENELKNVAARSNVFGNILGTFVDEMFRRARRLRPDLFYRMQRWGIVTLPNLVERRADIPILFHSFLPKNDALHRTIKYDVDLAAYERLMEKDLTWPGNIRELQAVTKRVYQEVEKKGVEKKVAKDKKSVIQLKITTHDVDAILRREEARARSMMPV